MGMLPGPISEQQQMLTSALSFEDTQVRYTGTEATNLPQNYLSNTPRAAPIPEETWDMYKEDIRQLYLERGYTRKEVLHVMRANKGFYPTERQLEVRLKLWAFFKKRARGKPRASATSLLIELPRQPDRKSCMTCGGRVDGVIYCSEQCRPSASLDWYMNDASRVETPTITTAFYTARSRFISPSADSRASFDSTQFAPPPYGLTDANPPTPTLRRIKEELHEDEDFEYEDTYSEVQYQQQRSDLTAINASRLMSYKSSKNVSKKPSEADKYDLPWDSFVGHDPSDRLRRPLPVASHFYCSHGKSVIRDCDKCHRVVPILPAGGPSRSDQAR